MRAGARDDHRARRPPRRRRRRPRPCSRRRARTAQPDDRNLFWPRRCRHADVAAARRIRVDCCRPRRPARRVRRRRERTAARSGDIHRRADRTEAGQRGPAGMSGFAGIVRFDGAPVSDVLTRRMAEVMSRRRPEASAIWTGDGAGFAYTLRATSNEAAPERQPMTLDGRVWIVGEARLDERRDVMAALPESTPRNLAAAPDIELVLRGYAAWRPHVVDRLRGDFAFAVWDGARAQLFAARDQLGVRPFFYARIGSCFVFSNTFACVRLHPSISGRLNDLAIADFLLFDVNQDPSTSVYADVR